MDCAFLPNVSSMSIDDAHFALGFTPQSDVSVDSDLPKHDTLFKGSFGKLFKKARAGVVIFKTKSTDVIDGLTGYNLLTTMSKYRKVFNEVNSEAKDMKMVVKVTPIKKWRHLLTCYKEAMMTNRIYTASKNDVNGSDIVCKPFMCSPVMTKKGWCFVFVSERALGTCVGTLVSTIPRMLLGVPKKEFVAACADACDKLWKLGFCHNDLHPGNVVYNRVTKSAKFIDLETAVEVLPQAVDKYVQSRSSSSEECYVTFQNVLLSPAMDMLKHSETWVNGFSIDENGSKVIYNTDCYFLWALT